MFAVGWLAFGEVIGSQGLTSATLILLAIVAGADGSPPKPGREQGDAPRSGVRPTASNGDKTHRKHAFPIGLSKLHRSYTPRFPTLALLRRLRREKLGRRRMIGVRETFTKPATDIHIMAICKREQINP